MALALAVFLIYPVLTDIKNSSEEILLKKSEIISINDQNRELDSFSKKYNSYNDNFEKVNKLFVNSKDPINFIKFLEKTANDSGISTDIKLDISLSDKGFNDWPVAISNISATGEFLNILKFSEKLDTSPYLMKIKSLTIERSPQESTVDANFLVEAITK